MSGLIQLAAIIFAGVLAALLSVRLKLPSVLGYLLAGVGLSLLLPREMLQSELVSNIAQLGAAFLLFTIGVEFSLGNILKLKALAIGGATIQSLIVVVTALIVVPSLGFTNFEAFLIGALVSLSSTAFVVKMLEGRNELYTKAGEIMTGWLVVQDVMIIFWFMLFQTFAPDAGPDQDLILALLKVAVVLGITLLTAKYALPKIMRWVAATNSDELLMVSVVGVITVFAIFANALGISFTIGAFVAGLALSESLLKHEIFTEIKPLRNLLMMIFFVSIGSLFDVSAVISNPGPIVVILLVLLVVKAVVAVITCIWMNVHIKNALRVGLGIIQVGEFAFLGAQLALHSQWISSSLYSTLIAVTVLSMAVTPLVYNQADNLNSWLEKRLRIWSPNLYRNLFVNSLPDYKDKTRFKDHVIVCGHGRVGKYIAEALSRSGIDFVIVEMDSKLVSSINALYPNGLVVFGDSTSADILKLAGIDRARALAVCLPKHSEVSQTSKLAKQLNPKIKIVARIHDQKDSSLESVDTIVEPEFEAAIQIITSLYKLIRRRHKRAVDAARLLKHPGMVEI